MSIELRWLNTEEVKERSYGNETTYHRVLQFRYEGYVRESLDEPFVKGDWQDIPEEYEDGDNR